MNAGEIYNAAHRIIGTSDLAIRNTVVNQTIIAEGGRDFKWVWMIIFIIFVWPAAIIYYFVAKKNTISVTIASKETGGCTVNIQSIGRKAETVFQNLSSAIQ
jgi:hypothetical protein